MRETWYVLENGRAVDPCEVVTDAQGRLVHKSGAFVAIGPYGPRSRGVDVEEEQAKAIEPEKPKRGYKTRAMKAD